MDFKEMLEFMNIIENMKRTNRTGWVRNNIPEPESVADHSFRVAILALLLADSFKLDKNKLVKMALIHDLAESVTGDITPHEATKEERHAKEEVVMREFSKLVKNSELFALWEEYENQKTKEAKFLYQIDKLESVIQALEYENRHEKRLDEFYRRVGGILEDKTLVEFFEFIVNQRKNID